MITQKGSWTVCWWLVGRALGPIGGLSARQFNSCLSRIEDEGEDGVLLFLLNTVLLGGSCNPTTWRHDIAIPFLKQHSISFYNPVRQSA